MTILGSHTHNSHRPRELPPPGSAISRLPRHRPTHEEISRLAYFYWESRGRPHGSSVEDWFRAERDLNNS